MANFFIADPHFGHERIIQLELNSTDIKGRFYD